MKRQKPTYIEKIYTVSAEEPGDYYLKPEGVLFIDNLGGHTLYSADSRFNFLRSAVHKFPFKDLEEGVEFREHTVRLDDVTDEFEAKFDLITDNMLAILHSIYTNNPRQYFFLDKHFEPNRTNSFFVP